MKLLQLHAPRPSLIFVLLLFVQLFLLFVFRPIGENSFCQRDIVIFLLRPPSRKESHDDASGSCVAKIERAVYNSARFIYFLLAEFYTHPLSFHLISFFSVSVSLFLSFSIPQCPGKLLHFLTGSYAIVISLSSVVAANFSFPFHKESVSYCKVVKNEININDGNVKHHNIITLNKTTSLINLALITLKYFIQQYVVTYVL